MKGHRNKRYRRFCYDAKANGDEGYCGVAALAMVNYWSYPRAAKFAEEHFGREHGKGTALYSLWKWEQALESGEFKAALKFANGKLLYGMCLNDLIKTRAWRMKDETRQTDKGFQLRSFAAKYPKGRFIVLIDRHAIAFKNGEQLDWTDAHNAYPRAGSRRNYANKRVHAVIQIF